VDQHENWIGADAGHSSAQIGSGPSTINKTWHRMIKERKLVAPNPQQQKVAPSPLDFTDKWNQ